MAQHKLYEERMLHRTAQLPIALHQLDYPKGTDMVFYLHWHKEFEFLVVTKGCIEFTIEDRAYLLTPGDLVFINSNFYHSAKAFEKNNCAFFALDFSYEFLHEDLHTPFSRKYIRPVLDGKLLLPECIRMNSATPLNWQLQTLQLLKDINALGEENLAYHELLVKGRIYTIWELFYSHAVLKNKEEEKDTIMKDRLKPVIDYMKKNYSYEITLAELSAILPMSEGQFCRIFKAAMKVSPFQYLMRYRIMKSLSLLIETDKKIGEIANLSGFNNISYYNKVFYKTIGCTPKEYRETYYNPIPPSICNT